MEQIQKVTNIHDGNKQILQSKIFQRHTVGVRVNAALGPESGHLCRICMWRRAGRVPLLLKQNICVLLGMDTAVQPVLKITLTRPSMSLSEGVMSHLSSCNCFEALWQVLTGVSLLIILDGEVSNRCVVYECGSTIKRTAVEVRTIYVAFVSGGKWICGATLIIIVSCLIIPTINLLCRSRRESHFILSPISIVSLRVVKVTGWTLDLVEYIYLLRIYYILSR